MIISLIVAMDDNRGIGFEGRLPWRLSSDLRRFRQLTMGHHIIVGRRTFTSIGKPLPGRETIVLTRDPLFTVAGCSVAMSLEAALEIAKVRGENEVFICGGAEVYVRALPIADRFYLTLVHGTVPADVFFPEWEHLGWIENETAHHEADERDQYASTFKVLER